MTMTLVERSDGALFVRKRDFVANTIMQWLGFADPDIVVSYSGPFSGIQEVMTARHSFDKKDMELN